MDKVQTSRIASLIFVLAALLGSAVVENAETGWGLVNNVPAPTTAARKGDGDGDGDGDEDGEKAEANADGDGEGELKGAEPDLSHPRVAELVAQAVEDAVAKTEQAKDEEWKGHKANHEKLLGQHREVKERLEAIEIRQKAEKAGVDEKEFKAQIEAAAQVKYDARKSELDELLKAAEKRATKAEARVAELEVREMDAWLDAELVRASIPEDVPQSVQPGAWNDLKRRVKPYVERYQPNPDMPAVARIKKDGSIVPGDNPNSHMTLRELISKARMGKGPVNDISFYFVSGSRGSGTKSTVGAPPRAAKWSQMDAKEKAAFTQEHGLEAVREAIAAEYPAN